VPAKKKLGGLGIPELNNFARALRLHWLWLHWTDSDRPWSGFQVKVTQAELDLFRTCTSITVGNGERTCFWKDIWLSGQASMDIAPLCYRLAWRKNKTVAQSMQQNSWMRGLQRISTSKELYQFVDLWEKLQSVHLTSQPDQITWRFTANGEYSCHSAYHFQFNGSRPNFHWEKIFAYCLEELPKAICIKTYL